MVFWRVTDGNTRRKTSWSAYPEQQNIRGTASAIILKYQKQRRMNSFKAKQSRRPEICRYLNQKAFKFKLEFVR
jgi:hypothetical protein